LSNIWDGALGVTILETQDGSLHARMTLHHD